ncbi:unnamed protein product [Somion occarium]|uniref:Uncharacterized protein n=1 Tax=Somion occarium TaxID=3059160 RepID=A0ABP1DPK4_9APHY
MSCRRHDRARLIGCRVGPYQIRGCGKGCCPYREDSYEDIIQHERYTFGPPRGDAESLQAWKGRASCLNPYRPKFVCVDCRRSFKQAVIAENEYDKNEFGRKDRVRPERERIAHVWKVYKFKMPSLKKISPDQWGEFRRKENLYNAEGEVAFNEDELQALQELSPTFHWRSFTKNIRCPQCGKEGRHVGGTFRPCAKTDDKGWERIRQMLESGEDFSYCMTEEEQLEAIQEGKRLKERIELEQAWTALKKERIATLQNAISLGERTPDEQAKFDKVRMVKDL